MNIQKITIIISLFILIGCAQTFESMTTQCITVRGTISDESTDTVKDVSIEAIEINGKSHTERNKVITEIDGAYEYIYLSTITLEHTSSPFEQTAKLKEYTDQIKLKFSKEGYQPVIKEFKLDKDKLLEYYDDHDDAKDPGDFIFDLTLLSE